MLLFAVGAGAATNPGLGVADPYAVLAYSTVTTIPPTVIVGDVGVAPGSAVTGGPTVTGTIHSNDASAIAAQTAVGIAYTNLAGQSCTPAAHNLTGQNLGGMTLTPGVYCFSSSAFLSIPAAPTLTLDALGDPNAVFIFQIGSTLTTASASTVQITNGGVDCNVFWQVGSSATIGTGTVFVGNILALASIDLQTNATVSGRALALNGAVTMDANHVGFEACAASTATASPTASPTASATGTATATTTPTATPVGQTPTPTATPVGQTPTPTATTATPVGHTPTPTATPVGHTPTPTATPVGQTPTPHITPCCLPRTGAPSSQGDQLASTLLLAGLVAIGLGAFALVLSARARRHGAQ
jgi:type VI secretion system secreted protein VgrG